jgi:hypothetical protein
VRQTAVFTPLSVTPTTFKIHLSTGRTTTLASGSTPKVNHFQGRSSKHVPISFWIFIFVLIIGIIAAIAAGWSEHSKAIAGLVGLGFGVVAALCLFNASATIVKARSVGVVTSFGKADYTINSGFHLVAPWKKVEKFDTSVKTVVMKGATKSDDVDASCVKIRLGNQTNGCADVNRATWNIDPNGDILSLYSQYKSFDNIEKNVVLGQLSNGLVTTLGSFDPLASVNGSADTPIKNTAQLSQDALTATQEGLRKQVGTQNGATATENAKANKALTDNGAAYKDPGVQYQNCLNLIRDLATRNQLDKLPATFNCGDPRSNVLVQAK